MSTTVPLAVPPEETVSVPPLRTVPLARPVLKTVKVPEVSTVALIAVPLNIPDFRQRQITAPLLKVYQKITPQISDTERTALEAGTVRLGSADGPELTFLPLPYALPVDEAGA